MPVPEYVKRMRAKIGHDLLFLVGAAAVVINDAGEILLQRRSDNNQWWLPGGAIEPGEEPAEAVVREVWEETGLQVVPERIVGVFGGPDFRTLYPNGDETLYISITFCCRPIGGELRLDGDESLELRYFRRDALPPLDARNILRIDTALRDDPKAYFRWSPNALETPEPK